MTVPAEHRNKVIGAIIALAISGAGTGITFIHNAYADDRYVLRIEDIRHQIQAIDNALFEIDQEISFAENEKERRKWQARKNYYLRQKQALQEKLKTKTKA